MRTLFLFDLDGALIDTAADLAQAVNRVLIDEGRPALPIDALKPWASHGSPGLLKEAFGIDPLDPTFKARQLAFFEAYDRNICELSTPYPGIVTLLARLRLAGVECGVVTNKREEPAIRLLRQSGLLGFMSVVIGSDSEGSAFKPKPDGLLEAMRRLHVNSSQVLYAGDDKRDVEAAHAAGIPVAFMTWGYSKDTPTAIGADCIAHHPNDLWAWFQNA